MSNYRFAINTRLVNVVISHDGEVVEELKQKSEKQIAALREEYQGCSIMTYPADTDKVLARYMPANEMTKEERLRIPSMQLDAGKIDPECLRNGTFMIEADSLEAVEELDANGQPVEDKTGSQVAYLYPVSNSNIWSPQVRIHSYHAPQQFSNQRAPQASNAKRWSIA